MICRGSGKLGSRHIAGLTMDEADYARRRFYLRKDVFADGFLWIKNRARGKQVLVVSLGMTVALADTEVTKS